MANILILSADKTDSAATGVKTMLEGKGHTVTLLNTVETDAVTATTFDLVALARAAGSDATTRQLVDDVLTAGTPVIIGNYTNIPVDTEISDTDTFENFSGVTNYLFTSGTTISGIFSYEFDQFELYPNYLLDNLIIYSSDNYAASYSPKAFNGLSVTANNSRGLPVTALVKKGSVSGNNYVFGANFALFGFLYGRSGFTVDGANYIDWLVNWLINSNQKALTISGNVTLDGNPESSKVVAVSADVTNPVVLGVADSDPASGAYTINTDYSGEVMVFTMQDYGQAWQANTVLAQDQYVHPTVPNGYIYKVSVGGSTGTTEPAWPTTVDQTFSDNGVTFTTELLLEPKIAGYKKPV